jgi:hypothetical protein
MDGVVAEYEDLTSWELSAADFLETVRCSAEERIVLLAAIQPDHRPHAVLMGIERHPWSPRDMEHREVRSVVQRGNATPLDGSERKLESSPIGDKLS